MSNPTIPHQEFAQQLNRLTEDYHWLEPQAQKIVDSLLPGLRTFVDKVVHVGHPVTVVNSDIYHLDQQDLVDLRTKFRETIAREMGNERADAYATTAGFGDLGSDTKDNLEYFLEKHPDLVDTYIIEDLIKRWEQKLQGYESFITPDDDDRGDSEY